MDKDLLIRTAKYQYGTVKAYLEAVGISKQRFYAVVSCDTITDKMKAELSNPLKLTNVEFKKIFD